MLTRSLLLALAIGVSTPCAAQTTPAFSVDRLADGVYAVVRKEPPSLYFQSNSLFVVGDSGVLVVDAQFSTAATRDVLAALRRITAKPVTYVVNTHGHDDHITGNQVYRDSFPGVVVLTHRNTRDAMIESGATKRKDFLAALPGTLGFFRGALRSGTGPDGSPLTAEERAGFANDSMIATQIVSESPRLELVPATRVIDDRLTIELGRRTVEILHLGRGHSDGDIVVLLPTERIVASGDLVVSPVPLVGSTSHPAEFESALEQTLHEAAPDLRRCLTSARPALNRTVGARETDLLARVLDNLIARAEQLRLSRETDPARRAAAGGGCVQSSGAAECRQPHVAASPAPSRQEDDRVAA